MTGGGTDPVDTGAGTEPEVVVALAVDVRLPALPTTCQTTMMTATSTTDATAKPTMRALLFFDGASTDSSTTSAVTRAGTMMIWPHDEHLAWLPTASSLKVYVFPQRQVTRIGMRGLPAKWSEARSDMMPGNNRCAPEA